MLLKVSHSWDQRSAVCVVLCSKGYHGDYEKGFPIYGFENVAHDIMVFHGGTARNEIRQVVTAGVRVLSLVAQADTLEEAWKKVYQAVEEVHFEGKTFHPDVARNLL